MLQLKMEKPKLPVIILSVFSEEDYAVKFFKAGASGYLPKSCYFEDLTNAIHMVAAGKKYLSPEISGIVIEESLGQAPITGSSTFSELTMREREVLQLLVEGKKVKEIADMLFVSIQTVHIHRTKIMKKLNIQNMPELIKYAIREGLTPLND